MIDLRSTEFVFRNDFLIYQTETHMPAKQTDKSIDKTWGTAVNGVL